MNEELLSALVDGEVSAFETRRALKYMGHEPEALARWERYHLVRSVLQNALPPVASPGFSARVMSRLEAEPMPRSSLPILKPLLGFAAAAGIVAIAAFGWWQVRLDSAPTISVAAFSEQTSPPAAEIIEPPAIESESPSVETSIDESARLSSYLVNHSEHAVQGMIPYARVVVFDTSRN